MPADRPPRCAALVRAVAARVARVELGAHVLARDVEAHRPARLAQQPRARGLGHDLAVDLDPHRARAQAHVDSVVRIARVAGDRLVLVVPVEGVEVEHHIAVEVVVGEPEPGAGAVRDRDRLARRRVHAERDPRVQQAGDVAVGRRRRGDAGRDVLLRRGVDRADAARLPDEARPRALGDRFGSEGWPARSTGSWRSSRRARAIRACIRVLMGGQDVGRPRAIPAEC